MALMLGEPPLQIEVVELLAPQHAGQRLAMDAPLILVQRRGRDSLVELVRLVEALGERLVECLERSGHVPRGQAQADGLLAAARHLDVVVRDALVPTRRGFTASRRPATT